MKVTFVALNYAPSKGGAQEHVRRLAEGLVARGHEVEVLTTDSLRSPGSLDPGRIDLAVEDVAGVRVRRFAVPGWITDGMRGVRRVRGAWQRFRPPPAIVPSPWVIGPYPPGLLKAARRAMRTSDVVVGCSAPFTTLLAPTWFRRGASARSVAMPLLHVDATGLHPALRRALRRSDRVMASTTYEAGIDAEVGVDPAHVRVIPPGTDPVPAEPIAPEEARRRMGLPERPTVGFVGRLAAYKGIDTVLAAAPALWASHPDTTVLVAGGTTGWEGHHSPDLIALGGDRFVVREDFSHDDRAWLLAACDIVVHPSREESFGLIALEAWAARRPVVLAGIGCVRSFVEPGTNAELIEPGDHEALARTLGALLDDPGARDQMAATGRRAVEERYDWEIICDTWDQELRALAEEAS